MTGEGVVVSVADNTAEVLICKSSACSHNCSECSACSAPSYTTTVQNPIGASPGERVVIEASTRGVLAITLLVYMLPVFFLIAAALLCEIYSFSPLVSVCIFAVLIVLWVLIIRIVNQKNNTQSSIVQIIKD